MIPDIGQHWLYVGPPTDKRVPDATYEVQRLIGETVWMIQLPHVPENVDWKGPVADLEDPALWQFVR